MCMCMYLGRENKIRHHLIYINYRHFSEEHVILLNRRKKHIVFTSKGKVCVLVLFVDK